MGKDWTKAKRGKGKTDRKVNKIRDHQTWCNKALQFKGLIPGGVEAALYGLGLLFTLAAGIWDQFKLHVGVWQTVGVHRNQIPALFDWGKGWKKNRREKDMKRGGEGEIGKKEIEIKKKRDFISSKHQ